jgi:hypothetical protein
MVGDMVRQTIEVGLKRHSAYIVTTSSCSSFIVYGLITILANSGFRNQGRSKVAPYEGLRDKNKRKACLVIEKQNVPVYDTIPIKFD